jgi:hypothetical protein
MQRLKKVTLVKMYLRCLPACSFDLRSAWEEMQKMKILKYEATQRLIKTRKAAGWQTD